MLRAGELAPLRVAPSWACRSLGIALSSSVGRGRGDFGALVLEASSSVSSILPLVPLSGDGVVLASKVLLLLFQYREREAEREREGEGERGRERERRQRESEKR